MSGGEVGNEWRATVLVLQSEIERLEATVARLTEERDVAREMLANATDGVEKSIRKLFGDDIWDREQEEMARDGNYGFNGIVYGVLLDIHARTDEGRAQRARLLGKRSALSEERE